MPNPFFKFKKFTVYHDRCAMKVGTDGVLLGAWTDAANTEHVLDIGTGTGLIALMIAQRNAFATIDAIDIDKDAVIQAEENIVNSPFKGRIKCYNLSLQQYAAKNKKKYDLIVSNPPFFHESLKSPYKSRSMARHTDTLNASELIEFSSQLLKDNGRVCAIYPYDCKESLQEIIAKNDLYTTSITNVFPTASSSPKRVLIEFSKIYSPLREDNLIIEKERHVYSDDFVKLVRDFYLKL